MDGAAMQVQALSVAAGGAVVQQDLNFEVQAGEVLAVMGPSGCGKSTLMRHLVGLQRPTAGRVLLRDEDLHQGDDAAQAARRRRIGVMFQAGALWSAMTLGENLLLPLRLFVPGSAAEHERRARFLLALVGLDESFGRHPAELSGGMRKRAALARALVLEPELLFLDEPDSGLDPVNAAHLGRLVRHLGRQLGTAVVLVSHDVATILEVADRALYLDDTAHTMTALGPPRELLHDGPPPVRAFLAGGLR